MTPRFEVDEEVIIKFSSSISYINNFGYPGKVQDIRFDLRPSLSFPIYLVSVNYSFSYHALDNKDRCKYDRNFPSARIFKLEEA